MMSELLEPLRRVRKHGDPNPQPQVKSYANPRSHTKSYANPHPRRKNY